VYKVARSNVELPALAYRRAKRKAEAEGIHFRTAEDMALAAAHAAYVEQRPEAATMTRYRFPVG
jgi:hypothetical protein